MIIFVVFIGVLFILSLVGIIWAIYHNKQEASLSCAVAMGALLVMFVYEARILRCPQAIDVYRGVTQLEITYKNGIATDSTVVWKEKKIVNYK